MRALIIHRDLMPALALLNDEQLGSLTRAACRLVADNDDQPPPDPALAFPWHVLREKLIAFGDRYDAECQRRSERARHAAAQRQRKQTRDNPR